MSTRGDDPSEFGEPEHDPEAGEHGRNRAPEEQSGVPEEGPAGGGEQPPGDETGAGSAAEPESESGFDAESGVDPESEAEPGTESGAAPATVRDRFSRRLPRSRRGRIGLASAATLALVMVVTMAVPTTRDGVTDLWCQPVSYTHLTLPTTPYV